MKRPFLLLLTVILVTKHLSAQTAKQPVPEFLNEITYLQPSDSSLKSLEKSKAKYISKLKSLGYGGMALTYVMDGQQSTIHFTTTDRMTFVIAVDGKGDPSGTYDLFKATVKNGKRSATFADYKAYGGTSEIKDLISYRVKKRGDQVYEIIPDVKLEKGEYFFANKSSLSKYSGTAVDVFAFSVE